MRARQVFVKLAAFFLAFAAALMLVSEVRHVQHRSALDARLRSSISPRPFRISDDLSFEVDLVTLDRENARSYTRLDMHVIRRSHLPEKLWVRTFFFSPDDPTRRVWGGDAIEIDWPFDERGDASVTVAAPCVWCGDAEAPRGGYFARVQVTDGREATYLPQGAEFRDIWTATPVVVHAERALIPRR